MSTTSNILKASAKMASATSISRILGLIREQMMAWLFGATGYTDAFLVAYRIPNMLRDLLAEGAFSSAFVPNFTQARQQDQQSANQLLWSLFFILGFVTIVLGFAFYFFSGELVSIFAPEFKKSPTKFLVTAHLVKVMSPYLFLVAIAALFMGALNSLRIFFIPALSPSAYNVAMIVAMLVLPSILIGHNIPSIFALGIGVTAGGVCQVLLQLPLIWRQGFKLRLPIKIFYPMSLKVMKMLGPGLIGFAATQINLIVNTVLATGTLVGAVSWLSYAFRIFQLPVGILGVSIGNSNLVHFSNAWKAGNELEAKNFLNSSYRLSMTLLAPAVVAMLVFSQQIITLIFEHGKFGTQDTLMTAAALSLYALGLPAYGVYKIFVPVFYTLDRPRYPVIFSFVSIVFNIIFCVSLVDRYSFKILALGTSVATTINALLLCFYGHRFLHLGRSFFFNATIYRVVASSVLTALLSLFISQQLIFAPGGLVLQAAILMAQLIILLVCYFSMMVLLGEREAVGKLVKKILKK